MSLRNIISEVKCQSDSPFSNAIWFKDEKNVLEYGQSDTSVYSMVKEQPFQYYLCFDVEATCEKGGSFDYMHEIIEFPILLIESKMFEIVSSFYLGPFHKISFHGCLHQIYFSQR